MMWSISWRGVSLRSSIFPRVLRRFFRLSMVPRLSSFLFDDGQDRLSRLFVLGTREKGTEILFPAVQNSLSSAGHGSSRLAVFNNAMSGG